MVLLKILNYKKVRTAAKYVCVRQYDSLRQQQARGGGSRLGSRAMLLTNLAERHIIDASKQPCNVRQVRENDYYRI